MNNEKRTFAQIATDILANWRKPYYGAVPYLEALATVDSNDKNTAYYFETAEMIARYFLANAQTFRGPKAKELKNELKELIK